jgi:hypothetical protein
MNTPRRNWQKTTNPKGKQIWAETYVSMNRKGEIKMSRHIFERMGSPKACEVLFDPANGTIGVQPASPLMPDVFHIGMYNKKTGQRLLRAYRTLVQFGLRIDETIRFENVHIDDQNVLILDLRTAKVTPRVTNHRCNKDPGADT